IRPSVMGYSRRIRLPSTTPQPDAFRAGSICSALVSVSFIGYATRNAPSFFRQPSGPVLRQAADAVNPSLLAEIRPAPSIFHLEPCCRDRGAGAEVVPAAAARP